MNEFLTFVTRQLIEDPSQMDLNAKATADCRSFFLVLPTSEVGKIIGKQGRTIQAIRRLMERAPGAENLSIRFEVEERAG